MIKEESELMITPIRFLNNKNAGKYRLIGISYYPKQEYTADRKNIEIQVQFSDYDEPLDISKLLKKQNP
ncbi:hypothetical protein PaeCFBP13512_22585 [Paenibacillus sp. CFBP13512]|nr:hypothetical protein [Paenibacillus nuruki]TKJ83719.1 hypothetical protein PaeCFBP13512_22585 [Paenibacillus sp. CFBP13512]